MRYSIGIFVHACVLSPRFLGSQNVDKNALTLEPWRGSQHQKSNQIIDIYRRLHTHYLIRINFCTEKISRKFAQRRPYARNFIRELRAERSSAKNFKMKNVHARPYFLVISRVLKYICLGCAKICPRENLYE